MSRDVVARGPQQERKPEDERKPGRRRDPAAERSVGAESGPAAKRLSELLLEKREKLLVYGLLLENQCHAIASEDTARIERYTELSGLLLRELAALQKAIDPLESMRGTSYAERKADDGLEPLREEIESLRKNLRSRMDETGKLVRGRMDDLRSRIEALRIPAAARSFYSRETARVIDISQ